MPVDLIGGKSANTERRWGEPAYQAMIDVINVQNSFPAMEGRKVTRLQNKAVGHSLNVRAELDPLAVQILAVQGARRYIAFTVGKFSVCVRVHAGTQRSQPLGGGLDPLPSLGHIARCGSGRDAPAVAFKAEDAGW